MGEFDVSRLNGMDTVAFYFVPEPASEDILEMHGKLKNKNYKLVVLAQHDVAARKSYPKDSLCISNIAVLKFFGAVSRDRKRIIPRLVFINPRTGNWKYAIPKEIIGKLEEYPFRSEPWRQLEDSKLETPGEEQTSISNLRSEGCKSLILYFGRSGEEKMKKITPKLKTWYTQNCEKLHGTSKQFEVVFISQDRDVLSHSEHGNWLTLAPAPGDWVDYLGGRYSQLAVVDISNGCQISSMTLNRLDMVSIKAFPYGHIVPDWDGPYGSHRTMCLSFAPTRSGTNKARQTLTSVAVSYKHVVDHPIGFAVVSGAGYASGLRKEFGLPKDFGGTVIANPNPTKGGFFVYDQGSMGLRRFVEKYLD